MPNRYRSRNRYRNRYRNRLQTPGMSLMVFLFMVITLVAVCFVHIRNQHVKKGDDIRAVETEIAKMDKEIEMLELRIAGLMDRDDMERRLEWLGSDLSKVPRQDMVVLRLEAVASLRPLVADLGSSSSFGP